MLLRPAMVLLITALALAGNVHAHPGHASEVNDPQTLTHYATHPDHLIVWLVAIAAVCLVWQVAVRSSARRAAPAYAPAVKVARRD